MKLSKVTFITLTSIIATSCGSENDESVEKASDPTAVKIELEKAKIKIEEVSQVGFTEVEVGE